MKLLLLDTETSGLLDNPQANIVELAFIRWSTDYGIISAQSYLVDCFCEIPGEITKINGISSLMIHECGMFQDDGIKLVENAFGGVDAVMCAYVDFDRGFLERFFSPKPLPQIPWIDFLTDLPYPPLIKGRSVAHIAADHGILNPMAHRALPDVLTMAAVLERNRDFNWDEILRTAIEPKVILKALVGFEAKDLAKAQGFKWNPDSREWLKKVPESKVESCFLECSFGVIKK